MRLLLAEDEKALSKALTAILERNNYSVDAVYDLSLIHIFTALAGNSGNISRSVFSGSNCRITQGAVNTAKATIREEKGLFVMAEIIAVIAVLKIAANHTMMNPKMMSCKLFKGNSTLRRANLLCSYPLETVLFFK